MKGFRRADGDLITARFDPGEAAALREAAELLLAHLSEPGSPAASRLFPDAYPDDPEASAEFRRFTVESLTAAKTANARLLLRSLTATTSGSDRDPDGGDSREAGRQRARGRDRGRISVALDPAEVQAWLRALTDIRLYLAGLLGIEEDGDTGFRGSLANRRRALVYGWLGYVQESLVRVLG